jgi:hypothetical protein
MERCRIVEKQLHIQVQQVGKAEVQRLLNAVFMGFEYIHGTVEMMQRQGASPVNADVFAQPLFITVELRTGRTCSVGHHGEERPFD